MPDVIPAIVIPALSKRTMVYVMAIDARKFTTACPPGGSISRSMGIEMCLLRWVAIGKAEKIRKVNSQSPPSSVQLKEALNA